MEIISKKILYVYRTEKLRQNSERSEVISILKVNGFSTSLGTKYTSTFGHNLVLPAGKACLSESISSRLVSLVVCGTKSWWCDWCHGHVLYQSVSVSHTGIVCLSQAACKFRHQQVLIKYHFQLIRYNVDCYYHVFTHSCSVPGTIAYHGTQVSVKPLDGDLRGGVGSRCRRRGRCSGVFQVIQFHSASEFSLQNPFSRSRVQ